MFKNIKIGSKIAALVLGLVFLSITVVSFIAFKFVVHTLEERYVESLKSVNNMKTKEISYFFTEQENKAKELSQNSVLKQIMQKVDKVGNSGSDSLSYQIEPVLDQVLIPFCKAQGISEIWVTNKKGKIFYTTFVGEDDNTVNSFYKDSGGNDLVNAISRVQFSPLYNFNGDTYFNIVSPIADQNGKFSGFIVMQSDAKPMLKILNDNTNLGESGETVAAVLDNEKLKFVNKPQKAKGTVRSIYLGEFRGSSLQKAAQGGNGAGFGQDYKGTEVLTAWNYIPEIGWGIVSKVDQAEIKDQTDQLVVNFVKGGAIVLLLSGLIALIFSKMLISPLLNLNQSLQLLSKGVLVNNVRKRSNDEIGQMATAVSDVVESLKQTAEFAHKIGEGDYEAEYTPLSAKDTLGSSLMTMRSSIKNSESRDKERNWIVIGVTEVSNILRQSDTLEELGDTIVAYVTEQIGAIQGAFYVVNDDNPEDIFIEMKSSYAYNKKKYIQARYKFAEGLIGQAAIEQDVILRTEIPDDYVKITSGLLGDVKPSCLLVVPLITDEKVYGVLEFAGFERFPDKVVKFVNEISIIIARTIFNVKVNYRTVRLLEESQKMSNELQEKQEILRMNAEEMESTQKELQSSNQQLELKVDEVNRAQTRMQLLLENASEIITIFESDGTVRYISPSVERILGYQADELVGTSFNIGLNDSNKEEMESLFVSVINNPLEPITIQYPYQKKNGEEIWLEATANNFLKDAAIQGIVINTRDITESLRAEREERMRSKMQALSENSVDLIVRLDIEGNFFYINPIIQTYTGFAPDHFQGKNIFDKEFTNNIYVEWANLFNNVKDGLVKESKEIPFTSKIGDKVMQVNAIPELDNNGELESVLFVSHDVTDRKLIELEIKSKNKKITESINYARRIQGAILPDNNVVKNVFPNSFILYKARDVVSGDFPWFAEDEKYAYIAAVDCTGHGVPGALISLIGYFLLNDIIRSGAAKDVGEILDILDREVTKTLRQDQELSSMKDGMDISICKVDKRTNKLYYAGAHRTLFIMSGGELIEIKGNKFPIGGGKFRNQTDFTSNEFDIKTGDSVYMLSDGFTDQFGGFENRKYGVKRLRELIRNNSHLEMRNQYDKFSEEWMGWKGDKKQTDDMLLIGIKF
ncbi:PAS domain S-box protein [Aureibacter tunicatorum]|uniref:PAS domain S-box-containing protein n=1 Tax=Aureibacter tunicatorum TaxID=866807 RepID=A0AAE3XM57_9BACT|nr:PAS domain S-box protein [Aureibacter tunicatorum]MDR6239030.1 PAS domain S-box-containing protein [Aureibacter tunicatorum]BDD05044.1 hypothetical protein AUTU_25270 [Aureibacter tunicatorum]